ncbi:HNH endonuclease signature motif containing protein [Leucobacter komagatae]|uniref:HNH nuclease domain-containing protein n=1 Tax=Leucobacter komagatae TaxID=55969 RepID=A0A0D0H9I0_9MICO|nr:HNH endonuclease signature motif containing protein [Leucobacter komagatae]KIP53870.1 hypothetical protein SD72_01520 [Leucobacter komagatae]
MTSSLEIRAEAIHGLESVARELRRAEARRFELLARGYRALPPGETHLRAYRAEAALALGLTEYRVDALLSLAAELAEDYCDTESLLREGRITVAHAEVITAAGHVITNIVATGVDAAAGAEVAEKTVLASARRKEYEHAVLAYALEESPNRLKPIAKRLAEQWSVESIEARQAAATARRRVTVVELADGMAELRVYMPAVQAFGLHDHLTRIANAVKRKTIPAPPVPHLPGAGPDGTAGGVATAGATADGAALDSSEDTRGADEIRVDALHELLSRDPFVAAEIGTRRVGAELRGRVQLVVTADGLDALLARHGGTVIRDTESRPSSSDPAENATVKCELQGYGPVSIDAARPIIASRSQWDLLTVCSHTGEVIRTDSYRPAKPQERFLVARDGHCRFPGCVAPTHRSEIDHTFDAALGGPTATDNLAHLCRRHHTLKGSSDWTVEQRAGGVLDWTSPTGRTYIDRPPDRLPERRTSHSSRRSRVRFEPVGASASPGSSTEDFTPEF